MMSLPPSTAILDANGVIGLAKAECSSYLPHLFTAICVPSLVVAEVTDRFPGRRCNKDSELG